MRTILIGAALLTATPALASTDAAMERGLAQASRACIKASNFRDARAASGALMFPDTTAQTAMLVRGQWKPKHMKGARATMLCLYDRRAKTAETVEAPGWAVLTH